MGKFYYLKNVVTLELKIDKCIGCQMCLNVCPHEVFKLKGKKIVINDRDACMECGACAMNCPTSALSVKSGVGCASAIINGSISGKEPSCGCCCESAKK